MKLLPACILQNLGHPAAAGMQMRNAIESSHRSTHLKPDPDVQPHREFGTPSRKVSA